MTRIAVVGLGAIGMEHLAIVEALPHAHISAVADARLERATQVGGRLGVPGYASASDVLEAQAADAIILCTPDHLHFADAAQAIAAGAHVLLEKPVATTAREADDLVALAADCGVVVMPGHTLRFEPRYVAARDAVGNGAIGSIEHGYLRRDNKVSVAARAGGRVSVAFFLGVHDIDALMWIAGEPVVSVQAMASSAREPTGQQAGAMLGTLRLASGAVVQVESAWNLPEQYPTDLDARFRLVGSSGVLSIDSFDSGLHLTTGDFALPMPQGAPIYGQPQGALATEVVAFLGCVQRGDPLPVTLEQAAYGVRVVEALEMAAATGATQAIQPATVSWR